jgi:RNA polymerase sigma-70 factor (sigma-E family)
MRRRLLAGSVADWRGWRQYRAANKMARAASSTSPVTRKRLPSPDQWSFGQAARAPTAASATRRTAIAARLAARAAPVVISADDTLRIGCSGRPVRRVLGYVEAETMSLSGSHDLGVPAQPGVSQSGVSQSCGVDPKSVTELFRAHHLELVRLAVMVTGDLATAEDVVQDVYERLHRRWPVFRNSGSGLAYVRASVLNGCRSAHRRAVVRRRHVIKLAGGLTDTEDAESMAADRGELAAALATLPRRQREVIVLRYYCDLDVAEISATLGIGPSSVRSTVSRGLAALACTLGEDTRGEEQP